MEEIDRESRHIEPEPAYNSPANLGKSSMSDHIQRTIADLQVRIREKEASIRKDKAFINHLCEMEGLDPVYADADEQSERGVSLSIRGDQFYGQPLAACIREVLEMRKALNQGPATVNELFAALTEGGFAFDSKNDDNAKRGLRISLTKNTATFHKLPTGKFGLLEWYPGVRAPRKARVDADEAVEPEDCEPDSAEAEEESAGGAK